MHLRQTATRWIAAAASGIAFALPTASFAADRLPAADVDCAELAPSAAQAAAPAGKASVHGRHGPLTAARQQQELRRVCDEGRAALLERQLAVLASRGEKELIRGNSAKLLIDGPRTFAAMKKAIAAARHRVLLQMYIIEDGGVAAEFAALLRRKAAEGVAVAVLYDSVGSIDSEPAFFDRLRAGGVAVCAFNPLNPLERFGQWGLWHRNHRKLVAVDQEVAFVGGINISNVYSSSPGQARRGSGAHVAGSARAAEAPAPDGDDPNADNGRGWRDTQVELRGPVVPALAAVFERDWQRQKCDGALGASLPAQRGAAGERIVQVIASDPRHGENRTYGLLMAAIGAAQRSVNVTMAYFAPGDDLVQALCDASRRGVDVQLVLPGRSDVKLVMHAARSYYERMLGCGIGIAEMNSAVMHAKTTVIDGVLSTVGSSNLDGRSIDGNSELDVVVLGEDFGRVMQTLFERDLAQSQRIDPHTFARRGLDQRLMEWFAQLIEPLL